MALPDYPRIRRMVTGSIALALVVVLLGAWTRISDAGLGCPDWPGCYGELVLPSDEARLTELQQRFPEQQLIAEKGWLEMIHRYAAGVLGLVIAGLAWIGFRQRRQPGYPWFLSLSLLALVIAQAAFRMWTVTLKLLPQIVTLHLLGGLLTLTLLLVLRQRIQRLQQPDKQAVPSTGLNGGLSTDESWPKLLLRMLVLLLFVQILLGGWTSSNYAGWACSGWAQCESVAPAELDFDGAFSLPVYDGRSHEGGLKTLEARAAIQMVHRGGAVTVSLLLGALCIYLWRFHRLRAPLVVAAVLLVGQNALGIVNVLWGIPAGMAIAHHAGAVSLLICLMWLYAKLACGPKEAGHVRKHQQVS